MKAQRRLPEGTQAGRPAADAAGRYSGGGEPYLAVQCRAQSWCKIDTRMQRQAALWTWQPMMTRMRFPKASEVW